MINVCFLAVMVYIGVDFGAVGTAYEVFVVAFFPVVILGAV